MLIAYESGPAKAQLQRFLLVVQRAALVGTDLARIAGLLRDSVGVEVWTESPTDATRLAAGTQPFSLEGWRTHFRDARALFVSLTTQERNRLNALDAGVLAAIDGFLASAPNLVAAFQATIDKYKDGNGNIIQAPLTQPDRNALAAAIEAEAG